MIRLPVMLDGAHLCPFTPVPLPPRTISRIGGQVFVTQVHLTRSLVTGTSTKTPGALSSRLSRRVLSFSKPPVQDGAVSRNLDTRTQAGPVRLFPSRASSSVSLSVFKEASRGVRAGMHDTRDGTTKESSVSRRRGRGRPLAGFFLPLRPDKIEVSKRQLLGRELSRPTDVFSHPVQLPFVSCSCPSHSLSGVSRRPPWIIVKRRAHGRNGLADP